MNRKEKIRRRIALVLLILVLVVDVCSIGLSAAQFGLMAIVVVGFLFQPMLIIKTAAILMGHFLHNDWQKDAKKFFDYRKRIIVTIAKTDMMVGIVTVIICIFVGVYSCDDAGCERLFGLNAGLAALAGFGTSFISLSVPSMILGIIISTIDKRRLRKKIIQNECYVKIKCLCYNTIIMEFNEEFLVEMGLTAMPEDQKQDFLDYVQEQVEIRIGERIAKGVSEEKLMEFDAISDPVEAAKWLDANRPDYREIVARTIAEIKDEIRANREKLI